MDEKKQEDTGVTTDTTPETMTGDLSGTAMNSVSESTTDSSSAPTMEASATNSSDETVTSKTGLGAFNVRAYVLAVAAILLICAGLLFVLEKEGRISTGLFSSVIDKMEASAPAARVNGVVITGAEFSSSLEQLTDLSATQGANIADANVLAQLRTQAIETLINAELLRQAAIAEGITVTPEEIEGRFNEIRDGIGGAEVLATRMAEFGVTEESLRKDIENEFLIQELFGMKVDSSSIQVSETDVATFYDNAGGAAAGLPPLEEVRDEIVGQLKFEQEQTLINAYIQELRNEGEVEILI